MIWRLIVRFDAPDEQAALKATQTVKACLEPEHGPVGTITVAEWVWEDHDHQPKPRILRGQV